MTKQQWLIFIGMISMSFGLGAAVAQMLPEPYLTPGKPVPKVRAIACNTPEQLAVILDGYSESYDAGREAFDRYHETWEVDAATQDTAPACDEVWFNAIIPMRTVSDRIYDVYFANGSRHRRYIIEVKPVRPDGEPADGSYFISSRWRVISLETAL